MQLKPGLNAEEIIAFEVVSQQQKIASFGCGR
jgi:hypothetical protein